MKLKYVRKNDPRLRHSKDDLLNVLRKTQSKLRKEGITLETRFVGSGKYKLILEPCDNTVKHSKLDLDCQIIINKCDNKKISGDKIDPKGLNYLMSFVCDQLQDSFKKWGWIQTNFNRRISVFKKKGNPFAIEILFLLRSCRNGSSVYEVVKNINKNDYSANKFIINQAKEYHLALLPRGEYNPWEWGFIRDKYKELRENDLDKEKTQRQPHFSLLNNAVDALNRTYR